MPRPARFDLSTAKARKPELVDVSAPAAAPKDGPAEIKHMTVRLNATAWRTIRALAVELDTTSHSLLLEGLNAMFQKHGKPPVA